METLGTGQSALESWEKAVLRHLLLAEPDAALATQLAVKDRGHRGAGREDSDLTGGLQIDFQNGPSDGPNYHSFGAQIF